MVEQRSSASDSYGQGRRVPMRLRDFISRMQAGDGGNLYLSTQQVRACGVLRTTQPHPTSTPNASTAHNRLAWGGMGTLCCMALR
jgi:hypothetical protein